MTVSDRAGLGVIEFAKGALRGRFDSRDVSARVEILVDGVVSGEAVARSGGESDADGRLHFDWVVPTRFFDERPHDFEARCAGEGQGVECRAEALILPTKYRPTLQHEVRVSDDGQIVGFAHNRLWRSKQIELEVWVDGRRAQTVLCNQANPDFAPPELPERRGFSITPPDASWLSKTIRLVVSILEETLDVGPRLLGPLVHLESVSVADGLIAVINRPERFMDLAFDMFIDGERVSGPGQRVLSRLVQLRAALPADADEDVHELSVRFAGSAVEIHGSPFTFRWSAPQCVVRNGTFDVWDGDRPADWTVLTPDIQALVAPAAGWGARQSNYSVGFEAVATDGADVALLRQAIDLVLIAEDQLECQLRARGEAGTQLILGVHGHTRSGGPARQTCAVPIDGVWAPERFVLDLPADIDRSKPAFLEIAARGSGPFRLQIASILAGAPGFEAPDDTADRTSSTPDDSADHSSPVANGNFSAWPRGFEFDVLPGAIETAEHWWVRSVNAAPAARARLTEVARADTGRSLGHAYGIELFGQLDRGHLTVETALDARWLAAGT